MGNDDVGPITLRIKSMDGLAVKKIQFDRDMTVEEAYDRIEAKFGDSVKKESLGLEYGLLTNSEDACNCEWLDPDRKLSSYSFLPLLTLEYRNRARYVRVRYLTDTIKTILVDDSKPVHHIMAYICVKFQISNHCDYNVARDYNNKPDKQSTDFHYWTDDEIEWLSPWQTLRRQNVSEQETILLRRRLYYSEKMDFQDIEQINLLYQQAKMSVHLRALPVNEKKAITFAGLQAQINFGDYDAAKFTSGVLDLKEYLPKAYTGNRVIEHKIKHEHQKFTGLPEIVGKLDYVAVARSLPSFGAIYFKVTALIDRQSELNVTKKKQLLGIAKNYMIILEQQTCKKLNIWPYTNIRGWRVTPRTIVFDFGEYDENEYHLSTTDAKHIIFLMNSYINLSMTHEVNDN